MKISFILLGFALLGCAAASGNSGTDDNELQSTVRELGIDTVNRDEVVDVLGSVSDDSMSVEGDGVAPDLLTVAQKMKHDDHRVGGGKKRGEKRGGRGGAGRKRGGRGGAGKKRGGRGGAGKKRGGNGGAGKKRGSGKKRSGNSGAGKKRSGNGGTGKKRSGNGGTGKERSGNGGGKGKGGSKGESKDGQYPRYCPCRRAHGPPGVCYEFREGHKRRCDYRNCTPTYECVASRKRRDREEQQVCIRRTTTTRVVPMTGRPGFCRRMYTEKMIFYVPYSHSQ